MYCEIRERIDEDSEIEKEDVVWRKRKKRQIVIYLEDDNQKKQLKYSCRNEYVCVTDLDVTVCINWYTANFVLKWWGDSRCASTPLTLWWNKNGRVSQ